MNRKLLSVILALVMVLGVFTPVFAEEAKTETTEAPAAPAVEKHIEFLQTQGIIKGDNSGDLMLEKNIDRASFAAILVRAAGKEATAESVKSLPGRFKDMTAAHWANGYATVAHDNNLMKGNPAGEFMPGKEISYAEIATTLVRFLGKEKTGFVYPTSYIAAATELGLFEGVEIGGQYTSNANRNNVFKMLYNALSKEDFGKYSVYKAIVLENDRVAQLKADEVKVEVLSVIQIANNVSERGTAKVGQQLVLNVKDVKVEDGLADTENLIGKVVDVTLDENNKLVKAVVDKKNYQYVYGGFSVSKDGKEINVAGIKYSARVDERYYVADRERRSSERDDRVYRTYLTHAGNNKLRYNYAKNFNFQEFAANEGQKANFARVTVKDGMVLFVDAYKLEDIAPVEKVARDGQDVYYYNDARNATVERQVIENHERVIGFNAKDGFYNMNRKDIKTDDVMHWMEGFYLIRTDAKFDTKLVNTYIASNGQERAVLADKEDKTIDRNLSSKAAQYFKSVYAYDDQHFRTLTTREYLKDMVGSEVKVLFDVRNAIQLITSHEKFTDRLALVNKVVSAKGMEFFSTNAPEESRFRLNDGWDSNYYRYGWNNSMEGITQANKLDAFNRLDLVYTSADKDGDVKVVAAIDNFLYSGEYFYGLNGDREVKNPWGYAEFTNERRNEIVVGGQKFRYTDDTEVLVINKYLSGRNKGLRAEVIEKVTLADVIKNNKDSRVLEAVVLTEKAYGEFLDKLKISTYGRYDAERGNLAKAIIFTNYKGPQTEVGKVEYGRVDEIYNWSNKVTIETAQGVYETFEIDGRSALEFKKDVNVNDFVEFRRVKDSDPLKARFDAVIAFNKTGEVVDFRNYTLTLKDVKDPIYTWKETNVFGSIRDGYAKVYEVGGYAEVIVFTETKQSPAKPTLADELDAARFAELVATARAATADQVKAIQDAYDYYNKMSDKAKELKVAKDAKKVLDDLYAEKVQKTNFKAQYDAIVNDLKKFDNSGVSAVTPANYKEAEKLLADAKALHGKPYNNGTTATISADSIEATVQGYVKTVKEGIVAKQIQALKDVVNARRDEVKAQINNSYISLSNQANAKGYTDVNNDFVKAMKNKKDAIDSFATKIVEGAKDDTALKTAEEAKVADLKLINDLLADYNIAEKAVRDLLNK